MERSIEQIDRELKAISWHIEILKILEQMERGDISGCV